VALPEIQAMSQLAMAGMSHRVLLTTEDAVERSVEQAIAERVLQDRTNHEVARDKNIAIDISNRVGAHVGASLNQALQAIARAMAG